jgi:hypothetical protein
MGNASGGVAVAGTAGAGTAPRPEKEIPGVGVGLPGELIENDVPPPTVAIGFPVDALMRVSVTRAPRSGSLLPER